jgi:hypothetical protein
MRQPNLNDHQRTGRHTAGEQGECAATKRSGHYATDEAGHEAATCVEGCTSVSLDALETDLPLLFPWAESKPHELTPTNSTCRITNPEFSGAPHSGIGLRGIAGASAATNG